MTDDADRTRRSILYAGGAALLTNALAHRRRRARARLPAKAAKSDEERRGQGRADLARHHRALRICGEDARPRAAARGGRQDQAACPRHHRGDGLGLAPQGRRIRRPLCRHASAASRRRPSIGTADRDLVGQCRARQRHGGPWRRDRRFPSRRPLPSRLRHRAGGARHRRARRAQRQRRAARGRARLRHRGALDLCARLRRALYRAALDPQRRDDLRRHGGGRRDAAARSAPGAPRLLDGGAAGLRHSLLGARPRACREGVRLRRHGRAQRRHRRHHGRGGPHRRRRFHQRQEEHAHRAGRPGRRRRRSSSPSSAAATR